jgi:putative flippase GtrA
MTEKKVIPCSMPMFRNNIINQFFLFSGVGILGTAAHYTTLIVLVQVVKVNAVLASCTGFIVGAMVNYSLNYRYTFRSNKKHSEAAMKFFAIALVGLISNALIMGFAVEILKVHYILAQIVTTGIVLFWNFTGNRIWTFRESCPERR